MNTFTNLYNNILLESIIDIPRNSLDPTVFEFPDDGYPIMHPIIKSQIMRDVETIEEVNTVVRFFVVGSILTKAYTNNSDIDVNVQVNKSDPLAVEEMFNVLNRLNGRLAPGTTHPVNYYIHQGEYDLNKMTLKVFFSF